MRKSGLSFVNKTDTDSFWQEPLVSFKYNTLHTIHAYEGVMYVRYDDDVDIWWATILYDVISCGKNFLNIWFRLDYWNFKRCANHDRGMKWTVIKLKCIPHIHKTPDFGKCFKYNIIDLILFDRFWISYVKKTFNLVLFQTLAFCTNCKSS